MLFSIRFLILIVKFFDTFSGIGGFALPLTELGHECIGFSEIDKYASAIYARHFPSHHPYGDITKLDAATLPDFDLLVGGFPCQAFSVAGKRRGFLDTRGTLFFDLCRIAKEKRPRLLLFENVKGLLNHAGGDTFRVILSALDDLGYDADWQVCNSKHFGVPQNRERVFIVGHLRGTPRPEVFPLGEGDGEPDAGNAGDVASAVTASYGDQNKRGSHVIGRWQNSNSGVVLDDTAPTLRASGGTDPVVIDRGSIRETEDTSQCLDANYWKGPDNHGQRTMIMDVAYAGREPRVYTDVAPTLRANSGGGGHHPPVVNAIRRLTPIECERLQGFPDNWTAGISNTQRYRCCGNAVTVNVVREIVTRLTNAQAA